MPDHHLPQVIRPNRFTGEYHHNQFLISWSTYMQPFVWNSVWQIGHLNPDIGQNTCAIQIFSMATAPVSYAFCHRWHIRMLPVAYTICQLPCSRATEIIIVLSELRRAGPRLSDQSGKLKLTCLRGFETRQMWNGGPCRTWTYDQSIMSRLFNILTYWI